jgi:hypothetical protein
VERRREPACRGLPVRPAERIDRVDGVGVHVPARQQAVPGHLHAPVEERVVERRPRVGPWLRGRGAPAQLPVPAALLRRAADLRRRAPKFPGGGEPARQRTGHAQGTSRATPPSYQSDTPRPSGRRKGPRGTACRRRRGAGGAGARTPSRGRRRASRRANRLASRARPRPGRRVRAAPAGSRGRCWSKSRARPFPGAPRAAPRTARRRPGPAACPQPRPPPRRLPATRSQGSEAGLEVTPAARSQGPPDALLLGRLPRQAGRPSRARALPPPLAAGARPPLLLRCRRAARLPPLARYPTGHR